MIKYRVSYPNHPNSSSSEYEVDKGTVRYSKHDKYITNETKKRNMVRVVDDGNGYLIYTDSGSAFILDYAEAEYVLLSLINLNKDIKIDQLVTKNVLKG